MLRRAVGVYERIVRRFTAQVGREDASALRCFACAWAGACARAAGRLPQVLPGGLCRGLRPADSPAVHLPGGPAPRCAADLVCPRPCALLPSRPAQTTGYQRPAATFGNGPPTLLSKTCSLCRPSSPAQTTDYQRLLSTFAEGLYTEMDFRNEALNAQRMAALLAERCARARAAVAPPRGGRRRGRRAGAEPGRGHAPDAPRAHPRAGTRAPLVAGRPDRPPFPCPAALQRVCGGGRGHPAAGDGADHALGADDGLGDRRQADHARGAIS